MKANIETLEPMLRPAAATAVAAHLLQATRTPRFVAVRPQGALFHAWRA